ncbi:MAG TPA: RHS repeat-associated core domain-containing protein [Marinagarivorans sp.]|nr:RHS repeat-associated core domain-containing protein [Cellvibrionaceae bacterium]HMY38477.1 RHS repeat-associated core domain-containing protein [Marinagarivorans sp.]
MMPIIKHFDPVMGIDIHIVAIPPVGPVPIPHPHIALVLDPMDYIPIIGATVLVGGIPRGTAGTSGKVIPHIPMGGPFVKPPMNEDEIFMGSATVLADGSPLSFTALPVLGCQDVGMISPIRLKKPKKTYGMVLPTSIVMGIPAGMPVLVGGPPTIDMMAMAMKVGFAALGKAMKKLRALQKRSARFKKLSKAVHERAKKIMDKLGVPPNIRNKVHKAICTVTGHPVDVAAGKLFTDAVDITLPGPIAFKWERTWFSTSIYQGPLGHGWHHNYDLALMQENGALAIRLSDGRPVAFPILTGDEVSFNRDERLWLSRDGGGQGDGYALKTSDGDIYYFHPSKLRPGLFNLTAMGHKAVFERILFYYDTNNRLSQIVDCAGRIIQLEYNRFNQIAKIHLPHPNEVDKTFCAVQYYYENDNLVRVDDALGQPWSYAYQNNLLVQEIYRNGLNFYFRFDEYSPAGRCIETWGDEGIYYRSIRYDLDNNITYVRDSLGYVSEYHHDLVLPHKIVDPLKNVSSVQYNSHGQAVCEVDALGYKTLYEYDELGNIIQTTHADGSITRFAYDSRQNLISLEELDGCPWYFEFNEFNQLSLEIDPLGNKTRFSYAGNQLYCITDPAENHYFFNYDQQLNLIAVADGQGKQIQWQYDGLGNLLIATDPMGNQRQFTHDLLGRVIQVNEPDGNLRTLKYDGLDNLILMHDRHSDVQLSYKGLSCLVARSQGGKQVNFRYDTEEQLIAIANEHGQVFRFELDPNGAVTAEEGFDGLMRRHIRDPLGRVHKTLRPDQRFSIYQYDAMDRIIEVHHHNGEQEKYSYRADGELMAASNSACTIEFERDALGNTLKEIRDGKYWVMSQYDALGYRCALSSSMNFAQTSVRDKQGNLTQVGIANSNAEYIAAEYRRNELGLEIQRTMPGGIKSRWQRDKFGRPVEHVISSGHKTHSHKTYLWGMDDRLLKIVESLKRETNFQHDILGNLTAAHYNEQDFDVRLPDAVGNLFKTQSQRDREYGPAGQLLSKQEKDGITRYQYDAEGNLIIKYLPDGKSWRYSWSATGNLAKVIRPDGSEVCFTYDPLGRRISKTYRGKITHWVWDGNNPLHEWVEWLNPRAKAADAPSLYKAPLQQQTDAVLQPLQPQAPPRLHAGSSDQPATWVFEPESFTPMGKFVGNNFYPLVSDYLGVPVAMFDPDGQKIWSAEISLWGEMKNLTGDLHTCPFRWPGQYEDEETGLYYNRFRYYDPDAGSYISQDPIGLLGGLQLYSYVGDPAAWIDPWGLTKQCGPGTQRWKNKRTKSGRPYKKPGPKKSPSAPHNKKIREIIRQEKAKGKIHIGGGSKTELIINTSGGKKPYRRMDASFRDPVTGNIEHHNVGKSNRGNGQPIARERDAISDVQNHAPPADRDITFHSYGTT